MSCHRGWCFASFLPPRLRVLLARTKNRACCHWWEYGLLTDRIICEGLVKGPLVCYFHLRVSCVGGKETMRTVVFRMWPRGRALEALNLSFRTLMVLE